MTERYTEEYIEKNPNTVDWLYISVYQKLSEKFIDKYSEKVYWGYISINQKLSEKFIEKYSEKVNWYYISEYQKLSEKFIEKYSKKVNWECISEYQKLSEKFIDKYSEKVNWYCISRYQKLSEKFIEKYSKKVNWDWISIHQKLSEKFIKKHNLRIPESSWMYKTNKEKEKYIRENTEYSIENGMVIAYKSCRSDGYSKFNFQYKYQVGNEYESTADFNEDDDASFGLSAWTKDGALEYCNDGKLFKVGIPLSNLACVVQNGKKLRGTKIRILEEIVG
jgi:phosphoribosylanthranilate isomerase